MPRPRSFDLDDATDRALELFWRKGYEGTTLTDLTDGMGINRPSLYAAFGNKEQLFRRALARYLVDAGGVFASALQADTAYETAQRVLRFYADASGEPDRPPGCMLVQSALVCSAESQAVQKHLSEQREGMRAALATRFERAKRDGELPAHAKPADLARYVCTVCYGLSVQAVGGATREQLRRVVQLALTAWPT